MRQLTEEESDVHYTQGLVEAVEVEKKTGTQRRMTRHNSTTPWEENMENLVHPSQDRKFQGLYISRKIGGSSCLILPPAQANLTI
jgi:hypothetical protein